MATQTVERQKLYQVIDALPEDGVIAVLDFVNNLRPNAGFADIVNDDGFYNPVNLRRLEHSINQLKQGKVVVKTIEELERMADE